MNGSLYFAPGHWWKGKLEVAAKWYRLGMDITHYETPIFPNTCVLWSDSFLQVMAISLWARSFSWNSFWQWQHSKVETSLFFSGGRRKLSALLLCICPVRKWCSIQEDVYWYMVTLKKGTLNTLPMEYAHMSFGWNISTQCLRWDHVSWEGI